MDSLEYSTDALEVKGAFYNKPLTIYVEGIDDPLFWNEALELVNKEAHIEDVGGCEEVKKYIDKIINEDADFYVALDRDHDDFKIDNNLSCERILFTYGYSIENTLYKSSTINNIICKYSRKPGLKYEPEIEQVLDDFSNALITLIRFDIANKRFDKGLKVLGDSCHRFLKNKNSLEICPKKVSDFIDSIQHQFNAEEIAEIDNLIIEIEKPYWFLIKGHFITSLIINIIKKYTKIVRGKEINLSAEDIYAHSLVSVKENLGDVDILHLINESGKL